MIVTCESCQTKFNLDASRVKATGQKVRCSRCGHVFMVFSPAEQILPQIDLIDESTDFEADAAAAPPPPKTPRGDYWPRKRSRLKILLWVIPVLVLAGAVYWLLGPGSYLISPSNQPLSKTSVASSSKPIVRIVDNTKAYFLENASAGQIFVVSGEVVNDSKKPVSFILLKGKLFTTDNQVAQSQSSYCGNVISRQNLIQQPVTDIQNQMMNREGNDLQNVHIPPGGKVPFMIVFHNLPNLNALSDYSIKVVSAETD